MAAAGDRSLTLVGGATLSRLRRHSTSGILRLEPPTGQRLVTKAGLSSNAVSP